MAIKKYISPDVFPLTIRDNFRKLMGQHYVINTDGSSVWNPDAVTLPDPGVSAVTADDTAVLFQAREPGQADTTLRISRIKNTESVPWLEFGLSRNAELGLAKLKIKVTADNADYTSLSRFADDMEYIFKNPSDGNGLFYDTTFECTIPDLGGYSSYSNYNYLVEPYEAVIKNASERILPNHYNIGIIERAGDEATFESIAGGSFTVTTPGTFDTMEPYQDTKDHTLLMGAIEEELIKDQGLFSDSYIEAEYLESGLTLEDFLTADLDKTLDVKYLNYYTAWPGSYIDLGSVEQNTLEEKGSNIIFSGIIGGTLITDAYTSILPTQNKLPFYAAVNFMPDTYAEVYSPAGVPVKPIGAELRGNLLYSTFGSHIAGVYDPNYVDTGKIGALQYSFASKTYYDDTNSQELGFQSSPELHNYTDFASALPGLDSVSSFNWAMSWHAASSLIGLPQPYSPVSSFSLDKKMFIDVDVGSNEFETDLAIRLSEDFPTAPLLLQGAAVTNFLLQTTQMTTADSLAGGPLESVYGPGGAYGLANQVNESFWSRDGSSADIGRLYKESFEEGLPAHNETVLYRVAKYAGSDTSGQPVQNIWIPSENIGPSGIEYIDSQVKYGEQYTYEVSAFKYVFGLKYGYSEAKEPAVDIVETVLSGDGVTIGYIVEWTGFANLFDDWELAIGEIPFSLDPPWATYANLYDPTYNYTLGDQVADAPGFYRTNRYFLSISRLNEIIEKAWTLVPKTLHTYATGQPENLSLKELFGGLSWSDTYYVTPDTTLSDMSDAVNLVIGTEGVGALDPATLSVKAWLILFFGSGPANKEYTPGYESGAGGGSFVFRAQWLPPSHHLLPLLRSATGATDAASATGFENLVLDIAGIDERFTYGSVEQVTPGTDAATVELSGYSAEYEIVMRPVAEIVEVPYFTTTTSVLSKPPPPPEVSITPYRGVNDTLLISMSSTNIEVEQYPIPIESDEDKIFEAHRQAQGVLPGGKIKFVQDDATAFFQVYRTEAPPTSYEDFAGSLRRTETTLLSSKEKIIRATSTAFDENLTPNIKYYYMFRSIDYHGNFSNPTSVYEVELVDDSGAVYLLVKKYEFPVTSGDAVSIDMKKFIEVIPAMSQVTADISSNTSYDDPSDIPTVELGNISDSDHRIWDKTFKIRLTSKKTGKKVDFNLTFNKEDKRIKTT